MSTTQPTTPTTWPQIEAQMFKSGAELLSLVMRAANARAGESQVLADLLRRADLAPRLTIGLAGHARERLVMTVSLHRTADGEPVAQIFRVAAESTEVSACLH